jgi:hypothetical protein
MPRRYDDDDDVDRLAASLRRNVREEVATRVLVPAIILLVLSVLSFLALTGLLVFLFAMLILHPPRNQADDIIGVIFAFGTTGVLLVVKGLVSLGAVAMARMRWYPVAMATAILQIVPCSPCWIIDTPIGVWALVILLMPDVREAFYAKDQ